MSTDQDKRGQGRSVLFVHGRDFKPDRDELFGLCMDAVRAGIERDYPDCLSVFDAARCDIAYYGDLTNELLERGGRSYDPVLDVGDRRNALRDLRAIPARKRFGIRQYDRLPGKSAVPEFIADFVFPAFCLLGLAMPIIRRKSPDFAEYLKPGSAYAEAVRERVRSHLCDMLDSGDDVMLVSHGTGAVVAYDVLWQLSHDPEFRDKWGQRKISLWVTMGAPLGDPRIRKRLLSARAHPKEMFPTNVVSWHNVAAEDDWTCHDKTLADDFRKMMSKRLVSAVVDYRVFNHAVRYGRSNPHSSVGYYIHPRVAKLICDWVVAD